MSALLMLVQALVLAALAGAGALALTGLGAARLDAALARQAEAQVQVARMRARLADVAQGAGEAGLPADLVHRGATAAATLALQQRIVDLGGTHDLTLLTFGAGRVPYQLTTPAVAVELEAQGEWSDAIRFLAAIEAQTPRIALASLTLRAMPGARGPDQRAPVSLRIVAWGLAPDGGT